MKTRLRSPNRAFADASVAATFESYPRAVRTKLRTLFANELRFEVNRAVCIEAALTYHRR